MTGGGADRSVECTGNIDAMISAFECVHDVRSFELFELIPGSTLTSVPLTLPRVGEWLCWLVCLIKTLSSRLILLIS